MKDHKKEMFEYPLSEFEGTFEDFLHKVSTMQFDVAGANMVEAVVTVEGGYDGFYDFTVSGWIPMTDAEKERAAKAARNKREAKAKAKAEKEAAERAEYERLKAKFGESDA